MELLRDVVRDNAAWVLAVVALLALGLAFVYGGAQWIVIGLFVSMAFAIYALWRTAAKRGELLANNSASLVSELATAAQVSELASDTESGDGDKMAGAKNHGEQAIREEVASSQGKQEDSVSAGVATAAPSTAIQNATGKVGQEAENPLAIAMACAFDHDLAGVSTHLDEWDKTDRSDTPDDRLEHEALRQELLAIAGSGDALIRLRNLANDNPTDRIPVNALAIALSRRGETRSAADELAARRHAVEGASPNDLAVSESQLRRQLKEFEAALAITDSVLKSATVHERIRIRALIERGFALEEQGRRLDAFGAFEKALEIDPTNQSVRYHLAYEYSQDGFNELSLSHYEQLLSTSSEKSARVGWSLNNSGVELSRLRMPLHAVSQFLSSAEQGNALAAANLAHLLLDRGFVDEAKKFIEKAAAFEPGNERAATATTRIATEFRDEEGRLKKHREAGERFRAVFKQIGAGPTEIPASGAYRMDDGTELVLALDQGKAVGSFGSGAKISFVVDGESLVVEVTQGLLGTNKHSGRGHLVAGILSFYLLDYPTAGQSTIYLGSTSTS